MYRPQKCPMQHQRLSSLGPPQVQEPPEFRRVVEGVWALVKSPDEARSVVTSAFAPRAFDLAHSADQFLWWTSFRLRVLGKELRLRERSLLRTWLHLFPQSSPKLQRRRTRLRQPTTSVSLAGNGF